MPDDIKDADLAASRFQVLLVSFCVRLKHGTQNVTVAGKE